MPDEHLALVDPNKYWTLEVYNGWVWVHVRWGKSITNQETNKGTKIAK